MKVKLLSLAGAALLALTSQSWAGDIYLIGNPNSLITATRGDLEVIMALNARHMKQAVRDMYNRLRAQGALFNLQPGARVEVTMYYDDGTAKIEWGNGAFRGFVNKDDLTSYLGSNNPPNIPANNQANVWANPPWIEEMVCRTQGSEEAVSFSVLVGIKR
jgi:hypothetical protein